MHHALIGFRLEYEWIPEYGFFKDNVHSCPIEKLFKPQKKWFSAVLILTLAPISRKTLTSACVMVGKDQAYPQHGASPAGNQTPQPLTSKI